MASDLNDRFWFKRNWLSILDDSASASGLNCCAKNSQKCKMMRLIQHKRDNGLALITRQKWNIQIKLVLQEHYCCPSRRHIYLNVALVLFVTCYWKK
jgi:hypothetical protein